MILWKLFEVTTLVSIYIIMSSLGEEWLYLDVINQYIIKNINGGLLSKLIHFNASIDKSMHVIANLNY